MDFDTISQNKKEFPMPSFLQNKSPDDLHEIMAMEMPNDIDLSFGGHGWNMTRPTALIVSMVCQAVLPEVLKLIFPEYSYGIYLDEHAKNRNILRRPSAAAKGVVTVTGDAETVIPLGSVFSTSANADTPAVDYITLEEAVISEDGSIDIEIACAIDGTIGNTQKNTIVFLTTSIKGVTGVTNKEDVTGGVEAENDDSLKMRIEEYDATQGQSFVGNVSDYKRWATSVVGVGDATIIPPESDDIDGVVTIVLTDSNGDPANSNLIKDVVEYIMRPDEPLQRLAPPNAKINVIAPETVAIAVKAVVELKNGHTVESVKKAFVEDLTKYLPVVIDEEEVKLTKVAKILSDTSGVNDFKELKIGAKQTTGETVYGTNNIKVDARKLPTIAIDDLEITSGTV